MHPPLASLAFFVQTPIIIDSHRCIEGNPSMRLRFFSFMISMVIVLALFVLLTPYSVSAVDSAYEPVRTIVTFKYTHVYKNRLLNAQASISQMQKFFDMVTFQHDHHYSFLRDVMHNQLASVDGYVETPLGYGYGSCGASSLLNKLVQTAVFHDKQGREQHVFQTIMIWTWRGDLTYGKYGATIFLGTSGGNHTKDYIWQLNSGYAGPTPQITSSFDTQAQTAQLTMTYGDPAPNGDPSAKIPDPQPIGGVVIADVPLSAAPTGQAVP